MIKLDKILSTTLLTSTILIAIGRSPPPQAQLITPNSQNIYLAQKQTKLVQAVDTIGITVSDMDRAIAFYSEALSFKKIADIEVYGEEYEQLLGLFGVRLRLVRMQLGNETIELIQHLTPQGKPVPIDSRSNDLWFQHIAIVVSNMDRAYQQLRKFNVTHVSTAPQKLPDYIEAAAGIEAFYFRDPDDNTLELIYFPPDKGDPRWQKPTKKLFIGIDHTAIAVSDTETSRQFYQDLLGLEVAGESENYGTEQEHLNNVEGARLKITGLKADVGIGVEFLEYLQPRNARPLPDGTTPKDLIHWETTLVVQDADIAAEKLRQGNYQFVSEGVAEIAEPTLGFKRAFLVRDPDGHVLRIVQR
ncbi:MAG: VOC family protein [Pleurocapsa sp. MO_226.B13]|nr:VOC family protein [Pleurocapsa sp. MO_226.B13]